MITESFGANTPRSTPEQEDGNEGRFVVAAGAMIEHAETGHVLLLKRSEDADFLPGVWENIAGRLRQFEGPEAGLRREVMEESGLEIEIVKPINVFHLFRGETSAENEMIIITYWCKSHSDRVVVSDEHSDYRWLPLPEALQLAEHEGVRRDIEALMAELSGDKAHRQVRHSKRK